MHARRPGGLLFGLGITTLAILLLMPAASAFSAGYLGEIEVGFNLPFILLILSAVGIVAGTTLGAKFIGKMPIIGAVATTIGMTWGIVLLLVVAWMAPGGFLHSSDTPTTIAPGAAAFSGGSAVAGFDPARYEPVSKVTWSIADAATKKGDSITATIKVYKPGVAEKAGFEGSATQEYTATTTNGAATSDGIQVQTIGCRVDVVIDASGYYQKLVKDLNICRERNTQGLNSVYPPTIFIDNIGTPSLGLTPTSLTCAAGSQCSYTLVIRNTEADSVLVNLAAKFTNTANATFDSVDQGQGCELIESSNGAKYVQFSDALATGAASCNVKITRASGSADGAFTWTLDDQFQYLGATAFNTHPNVRGATSTSALSVSFA